MSPVPPISVVIPTNGRPEEVVRAVRSVFEQDYPGDLEVVVVQMGKGTQLPTATAENRSLTVVARDPCTAGASRNDGVRHARHELIAFLDDDDYFLPRKLSAQVDLVRKFDAVFTGVRYHAHGRIKDAIPTTSGDLARDAALGAFFPVQTLLTTKRFFWSLGGFDPEIPSAEDQDLVMRMGDKSRVSFVREALVVVERAQRARLSLRYRVGVAGFDVLRRKHPGIYAAYPAAHSIAHTRLGWLAFAEGRRREARRHARAALRRSPSSASTWLLLIGATVLPPRAFDLAQGARHFRWQRGSPEQ
jgi:glycosyltransferase involved in cell wall biosynthesis